MNRSILVVLAAALLTGACSDPGTVKKAPAGFLFSDVSVGPTHACGVDTEGSVYCWGDLFPDGIFFAPAKQVPGVVYSSVSSGYGHTCALAVDGTAWCWGWGRYGQLGSGLFGDARGVQVAGDYRFSSISAGWDYTCGIAEGGVALCWGKNTDGQLGDGTTTNRAAPVPVAGGMTFATISAGVSHTCAVDTAHHAYCWGINSLGQLGRGPGGASTTPVAVAGGLAFTAISAGFTHSCGVAGQKIYCWGSDSHGELGDAGLQRVGLAGSDVPQAIFAAAVKNPKFAGVSAGYESTCAWGGGAGYCWGRGSDGQLGTGVRWDNPVPNKIAGVSGGAGPDQLGFLKVSTGGLGFACGLTNTSGLYCWGDGTSGQLASPVTTSSVIPVRVAVP